MTARAYASRRMDARERHLRRLTETIEAVNSSLDLEEVLSQVATKGADALHADACFVYLYDERTRELVLRATHVSFFFQAEDGIRDPLVTGVQTCALPI